MAVATGTFNQQPNNAEREFREGEFRIFDGENLLVDPLSTEDGTDQQIKISVTDIFDNVEELAINLSITQSIQIDFGSTFRRG